MNRGPSLSPRPLKSEKLKIIRQGIRQWSSGPGYRGVRQLRLGTYKAPKISENKYAPNVISPHNLNDRLASYMRTRALRVPQQPPGRKSVNTIHRGSYGLVAQKLASRGFFDTVTYASFSISAGIAARFSQAAMVTQSSKSTAGFLMSIYVAWLPPGMPWIWFQQGYTNHARVHSVRSPILPTYSQDEHEVLLPPGRIVPIFNIIKTPDAPMKSTYIMRDYINTPLMLPRAVRNARLAFQTPYSGVLRVTRVKNVLYVDILKAGSDVRGTGDLLHELRRISPPVSMKTMHLVASNSSSNSSIEYVATCLTLARCTGLERPIMDRILPIPYAVGRHAAFFIPDKKATSVRGRVPIIASLSPKMNRNNAGQTPNYAQLWRLFTNNAKKRPGFATQTAAKRIKLS